MKWVLTLSVVLFTATAAFSQPPGMFADEMPRGLFAPNRSFPNFIGFMSNPLQNVDPRSLNQVWPLFMSNWPNPSSLLPSGDIQVYGAGMNIAITDRLSVAATQGGYATAQLDKSRSGWLNLGGAVQYTLIEDVPNQFLLTTGVRMVAPTGEADVFQGHGPADCAPYVTIGKEFGDFHVLATTGYQFPFGGGSERLEVFYANVHFDYRVASWIYPVFEINSSFITSDLNKSIAIHGHFIDMGDFASTGDIVSMAAGFNFVLVQDRLEVGAVYTRPLYTQRDFDFNGIVAKIVLRF
ncbi:MAG TPA: hypothetical protein VHR72_11605 [Gemmataceae bacterium]|jgi:hypothetical protein|nr:hypothetical protein [Gemmataceae bacterium]